LSRIDLPLMPGEQPGVVLDGIVVERDTEWSLALVAFEGGRLWIGDNGDPLGAAVRLNVHAGDVSIALSRQDDSSILNSLPAHVTAILPDPGESARCLVQLALGSAYLLARITRRSARQLNLEAGQRVWAQVKSVAIVR